MQDQRVVDDIVHSLRSMPVYPHTSEGIPLGAEVGRRACACVIHTIAGLHICTGGSRSGEAAAGGCGCDGQEGM